MAAQEYFGGSSATPANPDRRQQNPSPWSSPAVDTPSSTGYGSYPPSVENGHDRYGASSPYPPQGAGCYTRPYSPYQHPSPQPGYQNPEYSSYGGRPPYPQYEQPSQYGQPPSESRPYPPYPQHEGYSSHQQPPPYSPESSTDPAAAGEGEKGIMGALAGGAAGGFAGHKVNHGFLGTIGGAMMGSVAEDAVKKHKEKKEHEEEERRREEERCRMEEQRRREEQYRMSQQQHQHHHRPPPHHGAPLRGNFSASARDIRLESHHDLVAACGRVSGELQLSVLPLNSVLANHWGKFAWERNGNFAASARNVRLVDGGRVLEAELADGNDGWNRTWIRLDERITNQNGQLMFLD
ncbi:putative glutamine-serine-proline rich protein [Aspergillus neoniger CBS 115656]|uniref:CNVH-domain-containing protein n=1 Tax=Aspergillus neoniger (strain CBS 115656) TaxID=1448310 RepID=A0A318Y3T3_ASPNB|nr:CNVH-domain-containing protein [Aspergillus neoniger CBS 115656]PYH28107.1 CNVH-domain-containing protein [Aspergillus neoniger CBS 115656]